MALAGSGRVVTYFEAAMKHSSRPYIIIALLIVLGIAGYGNSLGNRALFHHVPDTIRDPVLDNTMLRSARLFPKIFTSEFMAATYGEYRPLGYALFALINRVMPRDVYWPWHVVLLAIHLAIASVIFLLLRMLVREAVAVGLAAAYLLHPLLVPFVNDINTIYLLWGFLLSAITVWLYLVYLRAGRGWYLGLSTVAFAASAFTYEYALVVVVLLMALCLLHRDHPQGAAAVLVYLAIGAFLAGIMDEPVWGTIGRLALLVLLVAVVLKSSKDRYLAVVRTVPPYLVVMGLFVLLSATIQPLPLHIDFLEGLREVKLDVPFQPWFVSPTMLWSSLVNVIALIIAALLPAVLLLKGRVGTVVIALALIVLLGATVRWNSNYRDDVAYWEKVTAAWPEQPTLELNLATAYLAQQEWEAARDLLLELKYVSANAPEELEHIVQIKLGRAFAGLGNDKVAGYFFFGIPRLKIGWVKATLKNPLTEMADFCFNTGYISYAEFNWAAGLVIDPYDLRLHNNLGKVLVYKNSFRAAGKFFRHTLSLDPTDPTALYYLAFISQVLGQDREYKRYARQWQAVMRPAGEIDFQPIYDGFSFERDQMREWFSSDPIRLATTSRPAQGNYWNPYWIENEGRIYRFWEVPWEIGEYFIRCGDYATAARHLRVAHQTNPRARKVVERLAEAYRQCGKIGEASRFERLLEAMPDESPPE